jgi:hypothetical protein
VAVDKRLTTAGADTPLWFHPLTNEASIALTPGQLLSFIASTGHTATVVEF